MQETKDWKIILYIDENGCPVNDFMETLPINSKRKMYSVIDYLQEMGYFLHRPQADVLRDGIHELRVQLKDEKTRTMYFFCYDDYIVLTHTFIKRTKKVPEKEIDRALAYKEKFLEKYNQTNIKEVYNVSGFYKI